LYSSPSIIRIIKSRNVRWAWNVARLGRRGMHTGYWWEIQKERDHREDQDVGEWTILKWVLERYDWIDLARDRNQWRTLVKTIMKLRVP
jgi:hypothetical protein